MNLKIVTNWTEAKKQAVLIVRQIGGELLQGAKSEKILLFNGKRLVFNTWFSIYCYCYRILQDQNKPKTSLIPIAEPWIGPLPQGLNRAKTALYIDNS